MRKDPKKRLRNYPQDKLNAYLVFRELLWKAIDEKNKSFSIVETAKALGLYKGEK